MKKKDFLPFLLLVSVFLIGISALFPQELAEKYKVASTPSPTPRPLTFAEMNELYGPCVALPTLMYHHIQNKEAAQEKNQTALTVETDFFRKHIQELRDKGYRTASMQELIAFFDEGVTIPKKSVLLTFDDGYDDFAKNALPILNEYGYKATIFVSTGLLDNSGYLSWQDVSQATPSAYLFANHTWSHKNMQTTKDKIEFEISIADTQLTERGLNSPKIFSYPYGFSSDYAKNYLQKLEYKAAFTTRQGSVLCKKQRFELPRLRVGNTNLGNYGF